MSFSAATNCAERRAGRVAADVPQGDDRPALRRPGPGWRSAAISDCSIASQGFAWNHARHASACALRSAGGGEGLERLGVAGQVLQGDGRRLGHDRVVVLQGVEQGRHALARAAGGQGQRRRRAHLAAVVLQPLGQRRRGRAVAEDAQPLRRGDLQRLRRRRGAARPAPRPPACRSPAGPAPSVCRLSEAVSRNRSNCRSIMPGHARVVAAEAMRLPLPEQLQRPGLQGLRHAGSAAAAWRRAAWWQPRHERRSPGRT